MSPDLTSWLIENYGQEKFAPDPELKRIRSALSSLIPELNKCRIVTIAGTNGKGETTLRLSQYLKESSHCCWISPHISRITERFRDEKGEIDSGLLEKLILECHENVQASALKLSYYEFLFLVFCTWASRKKPEFLLLEVGLGGRLDAVNVFDAELILLPSISRDHQEYLGNRYELILREKLALLRRKTFFISYLHLQYLREKASDIVREVGCEWMDLEEFGLSRPFEFSLRNNLLAYAAWEYLRGNSVSESLRGRSYEKNFSSAPLEHRGERITAGAEYILFGSHNVDGMRKLIQFLHSDNYTFPRPPFDAVIVAFSQRNERDLRVLLRMLKASGLGKVVVTSFSHSKAASAQEVQNLCAQEGISFAQDIEPYVHGAQEDQHYLVAGSYYFLGFFKSLICRRG